MGSSNSKTQGTATIQKNDLDKDIGGNPDPRSPTPEITRTPLQNKPGLKHNITKNVDLRKVLENDNDEEKLIHNNPILSAVIKNHLLSFDPRSPTQEFDRTPIVISSKTCDSRMEQQLAVDNSCGSPTLENSTHDISNVEIAQVCPEIIPKNLCNEFCDISLSDSLKNEPLGSSTVSTEVLENNIISKETSKPSKLLETNFDYVENCEHEDSDDQTDGVIKKNETLFSLLNPEINNVPLFKILNDDPRSPSIGIDRTPIIVAKRDDPCIEENVEEMSDELLVKVLENSNSDTAHIKGKDSEGILIYEDDVNPLNDTPKKSKSASNSGSRTPLSCMKNKTDQSHSRSKSVNTLLDQKIKKGMSQIPKRVSQIPRLKSLHKQSKYLSMGSSISLKNATINGDCENTPPHSHRDNWDKDNSIVL